MYPGIGTYRLKPHECYESIKNGLEIGYRHIDTAQLYRNERDVQWAIDDSSQVERNDVHITTKVWRYTPRNVMNLVNNRLGMFRQQIDTLMLHHPTEDSVQVWNQLNQEVNRDKIACLGVSNFPLKLLKQLDPLPMVHQFEVNPYCPQEKMVSFCRENGIHMEGHTVLGKGLWLGMDQTLHHAQVHHVSPVHVLLSWVKQQGIRPLLTSRKRHHLQECWDSPSLYHLPNQPWQESYTSLYKQYGQL